MSISYLIVALPLAAGQPSPGSTATIPDLLADQNQTAPLPQAPAEEPDPIADEGLPELPSPAQTAVPGDVIVVTARPDSVPGDPLQSLNVQSFTIVQSIDEAVTGPVALTYKKSVPAPVRSGLRNFLSNLQEPVIFLNYLLQLKPGKGAETLGRFAINSTIGVGGLFDVAKSKPFNLPHRTNGFAYTLGYYGVKPGAYMYLPLMGPTTVRDLVGRLGDLSVLPVAVGQPFSDPAFALPTTAVRLIDERAEADDEIRALRDGSTDPYATVRDSYLRARQAEIDALHGRDRDGARPAPGPATSDDGAMSDAPGTASPPLSPGCAETPGPHSCPDR